jgi:uncharacterized protein (TIGR00369 family)
VPPYEVRNPDFERAVRDSFALQGLMATLGAELLRIGPGRVEIALATRPELSQQHGYLHAGAIAAAVDSACGYAAMTLMPPERDVLSVEFKLNLLAPAAGARFVAWGEVVRSGRTLTVCRGGLHAAGDDAPLALMQATMIAVAQP